MLTKVRWLPTLLASAMTAFAGLSPTPARADPPFPMSFYDPVFANVIDSDSLDSLDNGEVINDVSIAEWSGNPSIQGSSFTLNRVRISSRECIRAADSGFITLNWVWAEAVGLPGDHADVLQCYSPGSQGIVRVNNSTFRAHPTDTTAAYFSADGWAGSHAFNHVLFWGGPVGLRINCDGGKFLALDDVYFVTEGDGFAYWLNGGSCAAGGVTVTQWTNVFNATVVNGQLVVGASIPAPCSPLPCTPPEITSTTDVPIMSAGWSAALALATLAILLAAIRRSLDRKAPDAPGA